MRFVAGGKRCTVEYWYNNLPAHQVVVDGTLACDLRRITHDSWAAYTLDVR